MPKKVYSSIDNSDPSWAVLTIAVNKTDNLHLRIIDAFATLYPIPNNDEGTPMFTKGEWIVEQLRRYVVGVLEAAAARAADVARQQAIADVKAEVETIEP